MYVYICYYVCYCVYCIHRRHLNIKMLLGKEETLNDRKCLSNQTASIHTITMWFLNTRKGFILNGPQSTTFSHAWQLGAEQPDGLSPWPQNLPITKVFL